MLIRPPYPHDTTFWYNQKLVSKRIFDSVKQHGLDFLRDKTVLCMCGGVGRNADRLRELGLIPTNLDYDPKFIEIGKKRYPEIDHICYDYRAKTTIAKKFDYIIWEDMWTCGYREDLYHQMYRWSRHGTKLLPNNFYNLKVYRFNSKSIDEQWYQTEPEGKIWLENAMSTACVEIRGRLEELEDLSTSDVKVNIANQEFHIDHSPRHNYMAIGCDEYDHQGNATRFRGLFINNGLHRKYNVDLGEFEDTK